MRDKITKQLKKLKNEQLFDVIANYEFYKYEVGYRDEAYTILKNRNLSKIDIENGVELKRRTDEKRSFFTRIKKANYSEIIGSPVVLFLLALLIFDIVDILNRISNKEYYEGVRFSV